MKHVKMVIKREGLYGYFGKGETIREALKKCIIAGGRGKPAEYLILDVPEDAYITDYGDICYNEHGDCEKCKIKPITLKQWISERRK